MKGWSFKNEIENRERERSESCLDISKTTQVKEPNATAYTDKRKIHCFMWNYPQPSRSNVILDNTQYGMFSYNRFYEVRVLVCFDEEGVRQSDVREYE